MAKLIFDKMSYSEIIVQILNVLSFSQAGKDSVTGGHLYEKQLFTWLSLVVSLKASFVLSFFPLDVLDEIWDLIESVSEGFLTYSWVCWRK